ncbi:unnamed protein product [Macrosiphum euphorbiae]|uniref:Uncharacterized protein n=1 Tax=Macrosiphum euphorbiae TaxID=13131 RepID=A0AAV0YCX9_9HEMI|nr:unnamed protein product [Macrosiphum euphorbiae]
MMKFTKVDLSLVSQGRSTNSSLYAPSLMNTTWKRRLPFTQRVIKNHLTFADHKRCLFADVDDDEESDKRDDEFDGSMGKIFAADSALKAVTQIHRNAAISATHSTQASTVTWPFHVYSYMHFTPYRENVSIRSFKHELRTN